MIDPAALARAHRRRAPVKLRARRGRTGISPDGAYHAAVLASRPFRLGTRFRAVPDVRLYLGDDLVRGPGELLPGPDDRSLGHYLARIEEAGVGPFQLLVAHPLVIDYALWAEARALLRGLFARIGYPVLPVVAELVLGTFAHTPRGLTKRLDHDALTVVLAGRLRARLWDALWAGSPNELRDFEAHRPGTVLDARAGDVLYWPADRWHLDEAVEPCLALRLWIPADGARTAAVVKDAAAELAAESLGASGPVPYVAGADAAPLLRAGQRLHELAKGPALARELAIQWAKRVSTCGLEPAPAPLAVTLAPADRVRREPGTPIIRMRWRGESIWAANGHAFALRGDGERALRGVLSSLERRAARVDDVCGDDAGLRAVLEALAELRALAVAPEGG